MVCTGVKGHQDVLDAAFTARKLCQLANRKLSSEERNSA